MQDALRDVYALIGLIAVEFSKIDARLTEILTTLIDRENPALTASLTDRTPIARKIDLLKRVARVRWVDRLLADLLADVNRMKGFRNEIIHGEWYFSSDESGKIEATCRTPKLSYSEDGDTRKWQFGTERQVSLQELTDRAAEIERIRKAVDRWLFDNREALEYEL